MDIKKTKKDLLKIIRGKRSQQQLSTRLGHSFNQVYRYESDLTRLYWSEFVKICEVCKVDLPRALKESVEYEGDPRRADLIIKLVIGNQKITAIAKSLNVSRFVLADWCKEKSDPPIEGILQLLAGRDLLTLFIENLADHEDIKKLTQNKKKALAFFSQNPLARAVLTCLELTGYQSQKEHKVGFIAKKLSITQAEEKYLLAEMLNLALIYRSGKKYERAEANFNTKGDFAGEKKQRKFWLEKGIEVDHARKKMNDKSFFGFGLLSADKHKREKLMQAYRDFASAIYEIAQEPSKAEEELMVLNLQFFGLTDSPND